MTHTCLYCSREFARGCELAMHKRTCLSGPMGDAVRALILELSTDGFAPSYQDYSQARAEGMPTITTIIAQRGSWNQYVESLGLAANCIQGGGTAWAKEAYDQFLARISDNHGVYGQALHEWRERSYEKAGREYTEYYTVLR